MARQAGSTGKRRNSATAAFMLGGAVGLLALPSAVLAFATGFGPAGLAPLAQVEAEPGFQPAQVDPRLARSISVRALGKGQTFRFTPSAAPSRLGRSVTVAVRVDSAAVRGGNARSGDSEAGALGFAPTAYNLGVSRGYRGFAQGALPRSDVQLPDLRSFAPSPGAKGAPSRFSPHIALDEREPAGRAPRTLQGQADEVVDLGGSYRLTRNLNVTAGVRSTSDRDRLAPLSDGRKDNQAVYVGTQLKF